MIRRFEQEVSTKTHTQACGIGIASTTNDAKDEWEMIETFSLSITKESDVVFLTQPTFNTCILYPSFVAGKRERERDRLKYIQPAYFMV